MCRIVGIVDFTSSLKEELEPTLIKMRDSLAHGGPDDAGLYFSKDRQVALGNRRLAIIDTTINGHQPMSNNEGSIWITYNGEIYNFQQLRQELSNKGYKFRSKTDTEVLLCGYEEWGIENLLSRLRGMFAFAIYDSRDSFKLYLARDRFGIKPLYYFKNKTLFIFASEVRAILKSNLIPNEENLPSYIHFLQLGSVPAPLTTIKNVFSIPAGYYMLVTKDSCDLTKYWDLSNCLNQPLINDKKYSYSNALNNVSTLLQESVKSHLISDVPLGVFLSGGIDSSSIVSIASKYQKMPLVTLSITFDESEFNESKYSNLVARRFCTNHHTELISDKDFISELSGIFSCMDQPTIDGINTYFVSKAAKKHGLTVVLSGIGGDESFLGYNFYKFVQRFGFLISFLNYLSKGIRSTLLDYATQMGVILGKGFEKFSYLKEPNELNSYLLFRGLFTPKEVKLLLGIEDREFNSLEPPLDFSNNMLKGAKSSLVLNMDLFDFKHYLQNQILKDVDIMSMWHAIEVRVPFLDHVLVEKVFSLPPSFKINSKFNKALLVDALGDGLPYEVTKRKKAGFTFPIGVWIKKHQKELQELSLSHTLLTKSEVNKIWDGFTSGRFHWSRVWSLVVLSCFSKRV